MDARAVLTALADLAPAGGERVLDVTKGGQSLAWLTRPDSAPRGKTFDRLAALDALHREERLLRRGWGFVAGTVQVGEARRKVRVPLLAEPVRLERGLRGYRVVPAGDLEVTPLIEDRGLAARLVTAPGLGTAGWFAATGTSAWLRAASEAAGLPVGQVLAPDAVPHGLPEDGLVAVATAALYLARDVFSTGLRDALLSWARRPGIELTALATVYGSAPADPSTMDTDEPPLSPLPLSPDQQDVVRAARTRPLTVVSGPPGCGKSHAVVAAAIDVVDGGGSVLVATQSGYAADVLGELLRRYPGPTPVLFGDAERREAIATELAKGASAGADDRTLRADREAVSRARHRVRALEAAIEAALRTEAHAAELDRWAPLIPALTVDAPGAFEPGADLDRAERLLARSRSGRWRRWAAWRLRRRLGDAASVDPDQLRAALDAAGSAQAAARLAAPGGTDLAASWQALAEADEALAEAVGRAMRHRATSAQRWSGEARRGASALATALRAGRDRRRELLAALDGPALVRALPLWVGTVTDVEDLLPPVPGLFDLVILDEASHVDQIRAAPVLARARRALVVGDPRQLRFVSFVADVDVSQTLRRYGLDDRVDVRRVSAFDLAAGAAPVTWLGEHYRSDPHLIEFSANRFYGGRIALSTRHPRNEQADVIDVIRVPGSVRDGVNAAEISAVVDAVRQLARAGGTGIGVLTPFRAQADALESALLGAFPVHEIERLGLRVGTVHAFQGSEAEAVVASLGVVDGDSAGRRRFVADPNLFNVLVTRARRRMVVVTSLGERADGVVGEYLAYSGQPPRPPGNEAGLTPWARRLADELARSGRAVRCGYPVGPWLVDVCVGTGADAVGLICAVHPDGTAAHLRRQRALARAGWRLVDAYPSRWAGNPVEAALALAQSQPKPSTSLH